MSKQEWTLLHVAKSYEEAKDFAPLGCCTCPIGMKEYRCKHSIGLAIIFNMYKIKDGTRLIPLGKRKAPGRPKKVRTALLP
ncbi:unnamed protein product [Rotaria socialis]|uniref:SWIM-type domain-containing protein n=2 Tax=Rotaria socialis TaxID=392032 RepID=A0A817SD01_9BILA|nr:unnamed protein product [Rotaria socialis]CAF3286834.1 unnamed protein product [Rotaria socialis]CAF4458649.1 unnamed protein product [Rotaria socialis]CAF4563697.1 unnamed protein product [Rotaria socialis]CAF4596121.1 unnamed protein product [Rotaria socialis]